MTTLIALTLLATAVADPTGADIIQKKFSDATFTARVVKGDQGELGKISKDFGMSYRFKYVKAYLKEPLKMRLETNLDDTQMTYVLTDWVRYFKIPRAFINTKEDLTTSRARCRRRSITESSRRRCSTSFSWPSTCGPSARAATMCSI